MLKKVGNDYLIFTFYNENLCYFLLAISVRKMVILVVQSLLDKA